MSKSKTKMVAIRIAESDFARLQERAWKEGVTHTAYATRIIIGSLSEGAEENRGCMPGVGPVTGTKEEKLAALRFLIAPQEPVAAARDGEIAGNALENPPEGEIDALEWLRFCGVDKDGNRERGCGKLVARGRWIKRNGKDGKRGHEVGVPCCVACQEFSQ